MPEIETDKFPVFLTKWHSKIKYDNFESLQQPEDGIKAVKAMTASRQFKCGFMKAMIACV